MNITKTVTASRMQALLRHTTNKRHLDWWQDHLSFLQEGWGCTKTEAFRASWEMQTQLLTEYHWRSIPLTQSVSKGALSIQRILSDWASLNDEYPQYIRGPLRHEDRLHMLFGMYILAHTFEFSHIRMWLVARKQAFSNDLCYIGKHCYTPIPEKKREALMKRFAYESENGAVDTPIGESLFGKHHHAIEEKVASLESVSSFYEWSGTKLQEKVQVTSANRHKRAVTVASLIGLHQRVVFHKKKGLIDEEFPLEACIFKKKSVLFWADFFQYVQVTTLTKDEWHRLSQLSYCNDLQKELKRQVRKKGSPVSLSAFLTWAEIKGYSLYFLKKWMTESAIGFEEATLRSSQFLSLFDGGKSLSWPDMRMNFTEYSKYVTDTLASDDWRKQFAQMRTSPFSPHLAFLYHTSRVSCPIDEKDPNRDVLFDLWLSNLRPKKQDFLASLPDYLRHHEQVETFLCRFDLAYYGQSYQTNKLLEWLRCGTLEKLNQAVCDSAFFGSLPVIQRKVLSEWYHMPFHSHVTRKAEGLQLPASVRRKWDMKPDMAIGDFFLRESTDLADLMQIGSVPVQSCLNATHGGHRKCLFGYADYSKHLLLAYRNGRLLARVVLRLAKVRNSSSEPYTVALLFDRTYTSVAESERELLQEALFSFAQKRADSLGIPLLLNGHYYKERTDVMTEWVQLYVPYSENGYQYMDGFGRIIHPYNYQKDHSFLVGYRMPSAVNSRCHLLG